MKSTNGAPKPVTGLQVQQHKVGLKLSEGLLKQIPHHFYLIMLGISIIAFVFAEPGKDVLRDLSMSDSKDWLVIPFLLFWSLVIGLGIMVTNQSIREIDAEKKALAIKNKGLRESMLVYYRQAIEGVRKTAVSLNYADSLKRIPIIVNFMICLPTLIFEIGLWAARNTDVGFQIAVFLIVIGILQFIIWRVNKADKNWPYRLIRYSTIWVVFGFGVLVLIGIVCWKVSWPRLLGPTNIVLSALMTWTAIGTLIIPVSARSRLPIISLFLLYALVLNALGWNFNGAVYPINEESSSEQRKSIGSYFDQWATDLVTKDTTRKVPVFIVAAEGGGLRSGYWSSSILAKIQAECQEFHKHLFAISSVSGGSFGSGMYLSFLAGRMQEDTFSHFGDSMKRIMHKDYLAPVSAGLVYPNLLQQFIPFPISKFDRAKYLEASWMETWVETFPKADNFWVKPINRIYQEDASLPLLVLNTTHVESGKRAVWSYGKFNDVSQVSDLIDLFGIKGISPDYSLAQCVSSSARFPYVTPSARIMQNDKVWGHLVDGGYYENIGVFTGIDIYHEIQAHLSKSNGSKAHAHASPYDFHFIILRAYPTADKHNAKESFNELVDPVRGLYNTRGGHSSHSIAQLTYLLELKLGDSTEAAKHVHMFELDPHEGPEIPTSWYLSDTVRKMIDMAVDGSQKNINSIIELIKAGY